MRNMFLIGIGLFLGGAFALLGAHLTAAGIILVLAGAIAMITALFPQPPTALEHGLDDRLSGDDPVLNEAIIPSPLAPDILRRATTPTEPTVEDVRTPDSASGPPHPRESY